MTTITGTGTVNAVDLRITYGLLDRLGFADTIRLFQDLRALTTLGYLMTNREDRMTVERANLLAESQTEVAYISYQSPLEIVLALGASAGVALSVANRVFATHDRFQQSRIKKAHADVQVAASQAIKEEIEARRGPGLGGQRRVEEPHPPRGWCSQGHHQHRAEPSLRPLTKGRLSMV